MRRLTPAILLTAFSANADAYLDPGTGSMILQGIIAAVALAGVTLQTYWYRIQSFFAKKPESALEDEQDSPDDSRHS